MVQNSSKAAQKLFFRHFYRFFPPKFAWFKKTTYLCNAKTRMVPQLSWQSKGLKILVSPVRFLVVPQKTKPVKIPLQFFLFLYLPFFIFSFHIHHHDTIAYHRQAFSTKEKQNKKARAKLSYRNNYAFTLQKHSYYLLKAQILPCKSIAFTSPKLCFYNTLTVNVLQKHTTITFHKQENRTILNQSSLCTNGFYRWMQARKKTSPSPFV